MALELPMLFCIRVKHKLLNTYGLFKEYKNRNKESENIN